MADDVTPTSGTAEIKQMLLNAYKKNRRQSPYFKAEVKPRIDPRKLLEQVATDPKYEMFWNTTLEWTTESGEFGHVSDNEFALILIEGLAREFHRAEIINKDELTERLLLISQVRATLKVTEPEPDKITTPIFDIEFPAATDDPTVSTDASFLQLDGVDTEVVPYSEVTNMMEEITTGHNVRPSRKVHDTIGNLLKTNLTYGVQGMSFSAAFEKIFFLDNWYGKLLFKMLVPGDVQSLMGRSGAVGMLSVPFMNDHNRMWEKILEAAKTTGPRGHPLRLHWDCLQQSLTSPCSSRASSKTDPVQPSTRSSTWNLPPSESTCGKQGRWCGAWTSIGIRSATCEGELFGS